MARRRKGVPMNTSPIPLAEFSREEGLISPDFEHLPLRCPAAASWLFWEKNGLPPLRRREAERCWAPSSPSPSPFPSMKSPEKKSPSFWYRRLPAPRRQCSSKTASLPTAQKKCWPSAAAAPLPTFRKTASSPSKRLSGTKAPPTTTCRHPVSLSWTKSPSFT